MLFSYKTRRFLAGIVPTLLTVLVLVLAAVVCGLLWLQRFVVYTPQGVKLDFSLQPPNAAAVIPQRPTDSRVVIEYPDGEADAPQPPDDEPDLPDLPEEPVGPQRQPIGGYEFDVKKLHEDPEKIRSQLENLPAGTAVMVRVSNLWSYRYYTSAFGKPASEENRKKLDELIPWMKERGLYLVARMPAFRDFEYSLEDTSCGLPMAGGYLWPDEKNCYWLNPTKEKVLTRLAQILRELKSVGFDEVMFEDFTMPQTDKIVFNGDRKEAVYTAAETLVAACAGEDFAVSFLTEDMDFRLPEGNCRVYFTGVSASRLPEILEDFSEVDPKTQLVFFCENYDNRFDGYCVIRPLDMAM